MLRLQRGDKEAFRQLFERHYDRYLSFAKGLLRDSASAEDVVQDAFMKLWVRHEDIDPERSVHNLLLVIIRNSIYNYLRERYNARRCDVQIPDMEDCAQTADEKYTIVQITEQINATINRMPPQRRLIFNLSRRDHLSNSEIAHRLSISKRTVEKHIEQALRQLHSSIDISILVIIIFLF